MWCVIYIHTQMNARNCCISSGNYNSLTELTNLKFLQTPGWLALLRKVSIVRNTTQEVRIAAF